MWTSVLRCDALERLCRYLLRLKTPWRDGTSPLTLEPLELLEKLAAK